MNKTEETCKLCSYSRIKVTGIVFQGNNTTENEAFHCGPSKLHWLCDNIRRWVCSTCHVIQRLKLFLSKGLQFLQPYAVKNYRKRLKLMAIPQSLSCLITPSQPNNTSSLSDTTTEHPLGDASDRGRKFRDWF